MKTALFAWISLLLFFGLMATFGTVARWPA